MDVALQGKNLSDRTLRDYVPGLGIKDLSRFGIVNINKLSFTDYTYNFTSNFDLHSATGNASGKAVFDLRGKEMIYDATISTKNINLAQIFQDTGIRSDLN